MKTRAIILVWVSFLTAAFGQTEQPTFKGVPFGVGASTFLTSYKPSGQWGERGGTPQVYLDETARAVAIRPPNVSGILMGKVYSQTLKDSVANADADIVLLFAIQSEKDFRLMKTGVTRPIAERALFAEVVATFDANEQEHVLKACQLRYGEPTLINEETRTWTWDSPLLLVTLKKRYLNGWRTELRVKAKGVKSLEVSAAADQL